MSENLLVTVSDRVIEKANTGDYDGVLSEIVNENVDQLISGLVTVVSAVPEAALNALAGIYSQAIISQERIEMENIKTEAELLRRFNDRVDFLMLQLDLTNEETVENFSKAVTLLQDSLSKQFKDRSKPGILSRLFGR